LHISTNAHLAKFSERRIPTLSRPGELVARKLARLVHIVRSYEVQVKAACVAWAAMRHTGAVP
jgi:hypothetical protein